MLFPPSSCLARRVVAAARPLLGCALPALLAAASACATAPPPPAPPPPPPPGSEATPPPAAPGQGAPAAAPEADAAAAAPAARTEVDEGGAALLRAEGVDGAFVLFDAARGVTRVVNPDRAAARYVPASTFKIPNTLIGLETGVIPDERFSLRWDGVKRSIPDWNRDHDLASAMKHSVVWFYQEVARRIGPERMQAHLDAFGYGNRDISGGIDRFWLTGGLRISPHEQIDFLRRLHAGSLPCSARSLDIVKRLIVLEQTPTYTLRGKTGMEVDERSSTGWLVGYVERGADTYVYATVLLGKGSDSKRIMPLRRSLTRALLKRHGALPEDA
ncbi:penicillin-binding transpeptidase domain-containing protein [Sorangium sp. So ce1014]|uniref:penicillin-binding transpeptidase domain-containing protein n=1 Tax=Sorangium sp. So ce1014 TaxID=3133326 RepID=UPI003F626D29